MSLVSSYRTKCILRAHEIPRLRLVLREIIKMFKCACVRWQSVLTAADWNSMKLKFNFEALRLTSLGVQCKYSQFIRLELKLASWKWMFGVCTKSTTMISIVSKFQASFHEKIMWISINSAKQQHDVTSWKIDIPRFLKNCSNISCHYSRIPSFCFAQIHVRSNRTLFVFGFHCWLAAALSTQRQGKSVNFHVDFVCTTSWTT